MKVKLLVPQRKVDGNTSTKRFHHENIIGRDLFLSAIAPNSAKLLKTRGVKSVYIAGSDKSHRNVLLIPAPDVLINNISDYTVDTSCNIL